MSQVANLKRRQPAPSAPYQPATTGLLSPEVCKGLQLPAALPMIRLLLAGPRALKPALLLKTSNDVLLCLKIQPLQSPLTPPCFLIFLARPSFGAPVCSVLLLGPLPRALPRGCSPSAPSLCEQSSQARFPRSTHGSARVSSGSLLISPRQWHRAGQSLVPDWLPCSQDPLQRRHSEQRMFAD